MCGQTRKEMEKEAQRAAKLEEKVKIVLGGLITRHGKLAGQVDEAHDALGSALLERQCFLALQGAEALAAPARVEALTAAVAAQRAREKELQERYGALLRERADLTSALSAH